MTIHYEIKDQVIAIYGDTFRHKETIKKNSDGGARFNRVSKTWEIRHNEKNVQWIKSFCAEHGGKAMSQFLPQTTKEVSPDFSANPQKPVLSLIHI